MNLLQRLRKEQLSSRTPHRHIFRLTRAQEREIIDTTRSLVFDMFDRTQQPEHIASLFGCPIELLD